MVNAGGGDRVRPAKTSRRQWWRLMKLLSSNRSANRRNVTTTRRVRTGPGEPADRGNLTAGSDRIATRSRMRLVKDIPSHRRRWTGSRAAVVLRGPVPDGDLISRRPTAQSEVLPYDAFMLFETLLNVFLR